MALMLVDDGFCSFTHPTRWAIALMIKIIEDFS
ncbi:hypothetical protein Aazo_2647 ['Nostoc azollae' 0708]|uniref:Uncharacterized protein n=1 Tax=Nostoc azollae (strain 0708) TaxID=551115 RepID=D7DZP9_NOSA0|nr:hypothetical protein Aazo_2647 ['Nostoc azollae' 0708]